MVGIPHNDGYERERELMERDDRGVFGPAGLKISAALRKKFQTALLPASVRAHVALKTGTPEGIAQAEALLLQCLPRDQEDRKDDRYFGVYCGLADVASRKGDKLAALDWFHQAISTFPSAVRRNHVQRLVDLGVDASEWIRAERDDGFTETDAAAILARITDTARRWTDASPLPLAEMQLHAANGGLESARPVGRVAAARKHRR